MKIASIICLIAIAFAFGDALKCYVCSWTNDPWSMVGDKRCANHYNLPEKFLIECPDFAFGEGSCSLIETQDENMITTSVKRVCDLADAEAETDGCAKQSGNHGECTCGTDGCNNVRLLID